MKYVIHINSKLEFTALGRLKRPDDVLNQSHLNREDLVLLNSHCWESKSRENHLREEQPVGIDV